MSDYFYQPALESQGHSIAVIRLRSKGRTIEPKLRPSISFRGGTSLSAGASASHKDRAPDVTHAEIGYVADTKLERGDTDMFKTMGAEDYISKRVDQFQGWYDGKAIKAKSAFLRVRTIAVIGSALVPVVANITIPEIAGFNVPQTALTTIISLVVVIVVALDSVNHYGDQWKNYRSTEQFLSRAKFLFQTGEGPYKAMEEREAFVVFVERCEAQISAENSATLNVIATAAAQPEPGGRTS